MLIFDLSHYKYDYYAIKIYLLDKLSNLNHNLF